MILLVDAGNSCLKIACYHHRARIDAVYRLPYPHFFKLSKPDYLPGNQQQKVSRIILCSVKNQQITQHLKQHFAGLHKLNQTEQICLFEPRHHPYLPSVYQPFEQLGADRWAAVLALYLQRQDNFCIIDCGTAITVDVVVEAQHQGGLISPGRALFIDSLSSGTDNIQTLASSKADTHQSTAFLGSDTQSCIFRAADHYLQSYLSYIIEQLRLQYDNRLCFYLTTGEESLIKPQIADLQYRHNLVLEGLGSLLEQEKI